MGHVVIPEPISVVRRTGYANWPVSGGGVGQDAGGLDTWQGKNSRDGGSGT